MPDKLDELAQQRETLADEIALTREELARAALRMQQPLRRVDQLRAGARTLRDRYGLLLLPIALLIVLNPRRTARLVGGALALWREYSRAQRGGSPFL